MKPYIIDLKDVFKTDTRDQDKTVAPEQTVAAFKQRLAATGLDILEKTERIDTGRLNIPVFFSRCGRAARDVIGTTKQMGKGGTPAQAEASAVMELAERYSFFKFRRNRKRFVVDTFARVKEKAVPFETIAASVEDRGSDLEKSREFFETLPMQWTWAFHLNERRPVLLPFDWFYSLNEFNGPSAGNCAEEAILQGICEVVERHVSSLVSRRRLRVPAIRPASAVDPLVIEMLAKYERAGIRVFLSDFSLDTGIPTVAALAYHPATFPEKSEMVWTAGTTTDPQKALSRALTETAQLGGGFNTRTNYVASGLPKLKNLDDAEFVTRPEDFVDLAELPNISSANLKTEIERCVSALEKHRLPVFVIDITDDDLNIPAFYTIIPGAHFRERTQNTNVAMVCAKLIRDNFPAPAAMRRLRQFDEQLPRQYYIQFQLGLCRMDAGADQEALRYLQTAADLAPPGRDSATIFSYLGVCLKNLAQYGKALDALAKGEALDADRTDIHNLMGFCHFKRGEHEQAIQRFTRVLELNPESAIDYANIGANYKAMGDPEKAAVFFEIALSIDPDIEFARQGLAAIKAAGAAGKSKHT